MSAAILAGGRGKRMGGVNKAFIEVDGTRILDRQLAILRPMCDELLLVAGDLDPFRSYTDLRLVRDRHPGLGPLAGLEAALLDARNEAVLVLACDLPSLDEKLLLELRDAPLKEAVVARTDRAEPLCARYARSILPKVQAEIARGSLAMRDLLDRLEVDYVAARSLRNLNTIEDL